MIKLEQYRDTWLSEKIDEVIGFYHSKIVKYI